MPPPSARARRRGALPSLLVGLVPVVLALATSACSGADANAGSSASTAPGTTLPTLDPAIKTHQIAWVSNLPTGLSILSRQLTGPNAPTNPVRLGEQANRAEQLAYSPDGRTLVYASDAGGNFDIYALAAGATQPANLTSNPSADGMPRWSPDGTQIAFFSNRNGQYDLWLMAADGSNPRQLTHSPKPISWITWDRSGTGVLYAQQDQLRSGIYRAALDGSNEAQPLAADFGAQWAPDESPDGKLIAYSAQVRDDKVSHIYVMNADGSDKRRLTTSDVAEKEPRFSPDGTKILFLRQVEGQEGGMDDDIFVRDLATGAELDVNHSQGATARQVSWSPDGKFIMFTTNRLNDDEIAIVNVEGTSGIMASSNSKAPDSFGVWNPAPSRS